MPSFRSYRIAFYFSVAVAGSLELRPLGCAGNSARQPTGHWAYRAILLYGANGNGVYGTALRNGSTDTVFTETVTKRIRMNGNVTLETRRGGRVSKANVGFAIERCRVRLSPTAKCTCLCHQANRRSGTLASHWSSPQYLISHISLRTSARNTRSSSIPLLYAAISTDIIRQTIVQHCRTSDLELTAICCVKLPLSLCFKIQS